jgi:hypothetical protein
MFPALTYPTTQAHRDDRYRDARRRHRPEVRVREQLRRARRPAMIHAQRSTRSVGSLTSLPREGTATCRPALVSAPRLEGEYTLVAAVGLDRRKER